MATVGIGKQSSQKLRTKLLKLLAKSLKIYVNEFVFRTCNLTENELFLRYLVFKDFV